MCVDWFTALEVPFGHIPVNPYGCGSELNRRGKPQILVSMFPLARATHFGFPVF